MHIFSLFSTRKQARSIRFLSVEVESMQELSDINQQHPHSMQIPEQVGKLCVQGC